ncbi:MAG TPA: LacI family DNA-binding transcriptional regulator [Trueperaceae bacterium]|nr:LacI family DNA-binding transcriptional regulator [Trueperaceae bacterium]
MATIREVARLANVSVATVSRVMNGVGVTPANKAAVLAAIEQLHYRPNAFARSLATDRSGAIGVVVNEVTGLFYGGIVQGIESVVEKHGMHLMVSSGHRVAERERRAVESLTQSRADALILLVSATSDYDLIELANRDRPVVIIGRHIEELSEHCVFVDNVHGGYIATRHLIEQGHEHIAHLTGNLSMKDGRDRLDGYKSALHEAGIPFDEALTVDSEFVEEGGYRGMQRLLRRGREFTAAFAANDQSAAGALLALKEAGLKVPQDVSIVGYDDVLLARYVSPALTTVGQPYVEMGKSAARLALAAIGIAPATRIVSRYEPKLVIRESVAPRGGGTRPS